MKKKQASKTGAGNEQSAESQALLSEAKLINKSLLALGNVISALVRKNGVKKSFYKKEHKQGNFFRNSLLDKVFLCQKIIFNFLFFLRTSAKEGKSDTIKILSFEICKKASKIPETAIHV